MELRHLKSLVAIADSGSFSRAAAALNLAQPSLSRQIALLEAEVGQRLLVRTGRGVSPTAAGEAFLVHARSLLEASRRALDELRDLDANPSDRVIVGMPPRVALGLSVPLVQAFRERFPRAVVTVLEGLSLALRESLIAGRLDLALLFDPLPSVQLKYEPLMRERLVLVAPPGSRLPPRASLASLANYPMVLPNTPNAIRGLVDRFVKPRGITLTVLAEVGAVQTVLALVGEGVGCTILPESALAASAASKHLPHAPIGPPAVWNALVLAIPLARPGTRLTRETARLLRDLDFRKGLSTPHHGVPPGTRPSRARDPNAESPDSRLAPLYP
jgi:LysR family transcriptional regulator, nitrogen assimilation regulatory protein